MITVTLEGKTISELAAIAWDMFSNEYNNNGAMVTETAAPKAKGGRPPKEKRTILSEVAGAPITDTFLPADPLTPPTPAPVATLEEASAALKAIVNTAGMGMPKASAIMEKVTGKKLFREVTPDQYGALVAACKEAMK